MAYLELSREAYDNLIKAAGLKASRVAKICNEQGVWSIEAALEAPPGVAVEEVVDAEPEPQTDTQVAVEPVAESEPDAPPMSGEELMV